MKPANKAQFRALILIALLLSAALYPMVAQAALVINPGDDSWIRPTQPAENKDGFGIRAAYSNQPYTATDVGYIRFDVSSIYKDVGEETLVRLYVATGPTTSVGTLALWSTGDDWNGAGTNGNGDETTLTPNTAPAALAELATAPSAAAGAWVEFTGPDLRNFINAARSANGGDNLVSFIVLWKSCSTCDQLGDSITFEDREGSRGTTNQPQIDARGPNLVNLRFFRAADSQVSWPLYAGLGALALIVVAGVAAGRRRASAR